ncbi:MAG: hypothetical protein H6P95_2859 [Candidatus Aminicenantes bacterium]|nr:hypothetical protein [Candidatus Aminicenantes bacterium]
MARGVRRGGSGRIIAVLDGRILFVLGFRFAVLRFGCPVLFALGLLLPFGGELLFAEFAAEGRDLDDLAVLEADVGQTEAAADEEGVAEELLDLVGVGVRADVEIGRPAAEEEVADCAADEVGGIAVRAQPVEDLEAVGIDVVARDAVAAPVEDRRGLVGHRVVVGERFLRVGHSQLR